MAHQISNANGRDELAYSGETPWHGLGVKVDGLKSAQEMIDAAGLRWTVGTAPIFCNSVELEKYRAMVRGDNGKVLGVVSDRYLPIQNAQAADVMDALVTEGGASVEVCGALGDGERCWMLAHIPADFEVVNGDVVKPYMLLAWGHDGRHGLAGKLTPVRVVCNNTLTAAGFGAGQRWSATADIYVRHTKNASLQIEAARAALGIARKQAEQTAEAYRALAAPIDAAAPYFQDVFPAPDYREGDEKEYREKLARWNAHQERLLDLFENGKGTEIPGVRGTAWAAFNSVTEYLDHVYPILKSGEISKSRQQSVIFGAAAETKKHALAKALALVR